MFNFLVEYASGRKVPDVNSGLRLFKKSLVLQYRDSLCTGFSFTTTITLLFLCNHHLVKYINVGYQKRIGKSKVDHLRDTLRAGQIIVKAFLYYNPIKLFLLIGMINAGCGLALAGLNALFMRSTLMDVLSACAVASFFPIFCLGLIADQQMRIYQISRERYYGNSLRKSDLD
jgi:polyisoprenyl-phosphate glycosyltransferase